MDMWPAEFRGFQYCDEWELEELVVAHEAEANKPPRAREF
jgi:hypothetical protein